MANGDRIRKMTDEELTYWLMCPFDAVSCRNEKNCIECVVEWLKHEIGDVGRMTNADFIRSEGDSQIAELEAWKNLGDFNHIKELVQAEKEGRLHVIKLDNENTCGLCDHFTPVHGAYGVCSKRKFITNRWGQPTEREFTPARSRKACASDFEKKQNEVG